jgi:hypothetical protein
MAERKPGDPTQEPEFKRVLHNLLTTPHKTQSEVRAQQEKPAERGQSDAAERFRKAAAKAKPAKKKGG